MFTPASPRQAKSRDATPACDRIPIPTTLSFATPVVAAMADAPISGTSEASIFSASARSSLCKVKDTSVVPLLEAFCTIMSTLTFAAEMAEKIFPAQPGRSGTPRIVTFA